MENTTIRLIENLTNSFFESSKSWRYNSDLLHETFKEIAISLEESLGKECDNRQTREANPADNLSASISTLRLPSEILVRQGWLEAQLPQDLQVRSATTVVDPVFTLEIV
jgi:hypothetical protein